MTTNAVQSDYAIAEQRLLRSIIQGQKDIANRASLGPTVPIRLFQLMRLIGFGSSVEQMIGPGARRALVYQSGQRLGQILGAEVLPMSGRGIPDYLRHVSELCLALTIGRVILEKADDARGRFTLRVDECVSCAGITGAQAPICDFEAGLVGGLFRTVASTDQKPCEVKAIETRCNAVGDNTCAIDVEILP